ncbi:ATP-binding protein [Thalassomonas sp. M1454]|uniref:ATP-binding protein n=1 Tax=Thalassomonas sp. M1454 TaxID=2594477 RepID=UPI00117E76FE|nr:ATP-binding protein [Thalassomonas sp. M1454]TRX55905.1 AAA family ATPase [Thalassomonas sp. M1454]
MIVNKVKKTYLSALSVSSLMLVLMLNVFAAPQVLAEENIAPETEVTSSETATQETVAVQNESSNAQTSEGAPEKAPTESNTQDKSADDALLEVTPEQEANENAVVEEPVTANEAEPVDLTLLEENSLESFEAEFYDLKDKIASLSRSADDYEELYARLRPVLTQKTEQLYAIMNSDGVDLKLMSQMQNDAQFQDIFSRVREIKNFYLLRQQIFNEATEEFRALLTSSKLNGITEAKLEASYVQLQLLIITKATFQRTLEIPARFEVAPLDIVINIGFLLFAIIVFRLWRKWAKTGLAEQRQKIMSSRPRSALKMKAARAIWYFEHTRKPLEWLLFINFILANIDILQIPIIIEVVGTVALWLSLTFFAFTFVSKMIERGKQNVLKGISKKQSASLKWVIWWCGWYKLSFELTAIFIANGTIFSWLETIFLILLLPVYVFFIFQWRQDCFTYADEERDTPNFIRKLIEVRTGSRGFINANIALLFVIYFFLTKFFLSLISKVESGRRITAEIYRKKLLNDNSELLEKSKDLASLDDDKRKIFIDGLGTQIDSVFEGPVESIVKMANSDERSHIAVIGERGIGKTHLLKEITQQYPKSLVVNCNEDFDDVIKSVKEQLGIDSENVKTSEIIKALQEQEIDLFLLDNCHRMLTPDTSGQREIRRLFGWVNELKGLGLWVMTYTSSSWKLFNALGIATGFFAKKIELKKWSEEQICQLFDKRCLEAEIEIDYSNLIIPRQLADIEDGTIEQRNKAGVYRIIWGYADGNPAIACRTLADSLIIDNDKLIAKLPSYPDSHIIEAFEINTLLVLRVISQFGRCGVQDIIQNLRLHGLVVNSAIAACVAQGIIEQVNGRYQVSWLWYRTVSKYLARQNLLTR